MATRVITAEELAKVAEYHLPDMGGGRPGNRPPTVAELEKLQAEAYREAREEGLRQGYDEGFAAGRRDGIAEGQQLVQQQGAHISSLINSLAQPFADLDEQVESQLVHMAMLLAQQIIRREIRTQPGEVVAVVREALAMLPVSARSVNVYVHPDDAQLLRDATAAQDKSWKIIEEPLLARGGCRVLSESSSIDATLEKRLSNLAVQVLGDERAGARMLQTVTDAESESIARLEAQALAASKKAALEAKPAEPIALVPMDEPVEMADVDADAEVAGAATVDPVNDVTEATPTAIEVDNSTAEGKPDADDEA